MGKKKAVCVAYLNGNTNVMIAVVSGLIYLYQSKLENMNVVSWAIYGMLFEMPND